MNTDATTETIAHFIGLFDLAIEELRLRQDYLEFRLEQSPPEETPPLEVIPVRLEAPYELQAHDPRLAYTPTPPDLLPTTPPAMEIPIGPSALELPPPPAHDLPEVEGPVARIVFPVGVLGFPLEPAGSVVSVTLQSATLIDDDLFLDGLGIPFTDPAVLHEALQAIAQTAEALVGFDLPELPQGGGWMTFAPEMLAEIDAAAPPASGPAEAWQFRGPAADGVIVDGEAVEEAPVWSDLLPRYLKPEDAEDDPAGGAGEAHSPGATVVSRSDVAGEEGTAEALPEHDFAKDFDDHAPNPFALDPGHEIVAGANTAINEIALASQWIDAPVIVVRGNVAKVDAISQVNVLVEHDTIDGRTAGGESHVLNVAEISTVASEDAGRSDSDVLPGAWQVVRVEADVIQVNWVKQFTFATDFDRAEVTFSGASTYLGLGGNEIVNAAALAELGYAWDLIFVAGDMVDASVVSQKNALFDSDRITTKGGAEAAAVEPASDAATALDAALRPTAIEEPGLAAAGTAGARPSPDLDGPAESVPPADVAEAAPAPAPSVPTEDAPGQISTADNLLLNQATLTTNGVDTFVEMTEAFAEAAEQLAQGAETIAREVAQDAMFAGREALRVLQIDGDLAKINLFEQTNIVGDADQIHLEMEALRDRLEAEMKLVAGSNALVNIASAVEHGVDSQIMAAGQLYDDAFIHQAELVDTDAIPSGVTLSALANEAVAAFLVDDMIGATEAGDEIVPTASYEASSHADVMQTALA